MLTSFYKQYYQFLKSLKDKPLHVIKHGHVWFDIKVSELNDKNHAHLSYHDISDIEDRDFPPIFRKCNYAYKWYLRTVKYVKYMKTYSIKDPDNFAREADKITGVDLKQCSQLIYNQGLNRAKDKGLIPKPGTNITRSIAEQTERTIHHESDPLPDKHIYAQIVKDDDQNVRPFLKRIYTEETEI